MTSGRAMIVALVSVAMVLLAPLPVQAGEGDRWQIRDRLIETWSPYKNVVKGRVFHKTDGVVDAVYDDGVLKVHRKTCRQCRWRLVKKDPTDEAGRFRTTITVGYGEEVWWRIKAPARDGYGARSVGWWLAIQ